MRILMMMLALSVPSISFAKDIKITVKGMVCGFCAQGITKKFKAEPSISNVDVKLSDKLVTLSTKDGQDIEDTKIEGILKEAGYNVEKIER